MVLWQVWMVSDGWNEMTKSANQGYIIGVGLITHQAHIAGSFRKLQVSVPWQASGPRLHNKDQVDNGETTHLS